MRFPSEKNSVGEVAPPESGLRGVWILFAVVLLEVTGAAPLVAFLPDMITDFFAAEYTGDPSYHCSDLDHQAHTLPKACREAHSKAVLIAGSTEFISYALIAVFMAPLMGAWSDVYGRKPFLILIPIGFLIPKLALFGHIYTGLSLYWYFIMDLMCVGIRTNVAIRAYIADSVESHQKPVFFTLFVSAVAVGYVVGSILVIADIIQSVVVAAMLSMISNVFCLVSVILFIPESLKAETEVRSTTRMSLKETLGLLTRNRLLSCLTVCLLAVGVAHIDSAGRILYQYLEEVANFTKHDIAITIVLMSGGWLMAPVLVYLLESVLHLNKTSMLMGCFAGLVVQAILFAFATAKLVAFIAIPLSCLSVVVSSTVNSMKSDMTAASKQGALQGAIDSLQSFVKGIAPLAFLAAFLACRSDAFYFPGASMLLIACIQFVGIYFAYKARLLLLTDDSGGVELPPIAQYQTVGDQENGITDE